MSESRIIQGDCLDVLPTLTECSINLVVTSPPFWNVRNYGVPPRVWDVSLPCEHQWTEEVVLHKGGLGQNQGVNGPSSPYQAAGSDSGQVVNQGQFCLRCGAWKGCLGAEPSPQLFVAHLVQIFRECRRVLRDDGLLIVNMGDGYAGYWGLNYSHRPTGFDRTGDSTTVPNKVTPKWEAMGIKPKDLLEIPSLLANALRVDGWYLRSRLPWVKPIVLPESVTDRPSSSIEYVFMFSKQERYYWDPEPIRRRLVMKPQRRLTQRDSKRDQAMQAHRVAPYNLRDEPGIDANPNGRNYRNGDLYFDSLDALIDAEEEYLDYLCDVRVHGGLLLDRDGEPMALQVMPKALREQHYASYPEMFVQPFILAGTSERGICPECGSPWRRLVKRETHFEGGSGKAGRTAEDANANGKWAGKQYGKNIKLGPVVRTKTLGWAPGCEHKAAPAPAIVLDPFSGAGTTGVVALKLGRSYLGIELNPDYVELSERRITKSVGTLMDEASVSEVEQIDLAQLEMGLEVSGDVSES